jgi:hypothetical protein
LAKTTDPAKLAGRVGHQVVEAQLEVVLAPPREPVRRLHAIAPVAGQELDVVARSEPDLPEREGHIAPVADDVDEVRLREAAADAVHALPIERRLVAPPRLPVPSRIEAVDTAQPLGGGEAGQAAHGLVERGGVHLQVGPVRGRR